MSYDRIKQKFPAKNETRVRQFIVNFQGTADEDEFDAMMAECDAEFEEVQISDNEWPGDNDPVFTELIEEIGGETSITYLNEQMAENFFTAPRFHPTGTNDDTRTGARGYTLRAESSDLLDLSNIDVPYSQTINSGNILAYDDVGNIAQCNGRNIHGTKVEVD